VVIEQGTCRFVSRKSHQLTAYRSLEKELVKEVKARTALLDGELVVTDEVGPTIFASMMKRQHQLVRYFAFDLVWLNGKMRDCPCFAESTLLNGFFCRPCSAHVLYVDRTRGSGRQLYECACQLDLEGIVAKP
jgi:bifunctional non-homologous end joining protein LigD